MGGISTTSMNIMMHRVVNAVNSELKDELIRFPSDDYLRENAEFNLQKYKLADFAYAVDGSHFIFEEKPRGLPPGRNKQQFMNRKIRPSLTPYGGQTSSSCGGLMAFVHLIWAMFVYGSGCFFCFIHHGTPTGSFLETCVKIRLDLAEVFRILKCLFVYLFVY